MKATLLSTSLLFSLAAAVPSNNSNNKFQRRCNRLAQTFNPDSKTQVLLSQYVPAGTILTNPDNHPTCQGRPTTTALADMCRLRLKVKTSNTSGLEMEVWMPVNWQKKRYLVLGNGGLGGCLAYADMAFTTWLGFATVTHNNGHLGDTAEPMMNNPGVIEDFAYRAVKTATNSGKKAVKHFYQKSIKNSYFMGCSTGGRQGLKAAQDFPEAFDGIISGAPAINYNNIMAASGHYKKINGNPGDPGYLSLAQWTAMQAEILSQCDGLDGVVDGVIEEPRTCYPRFEALMCATGQTWASHGCLTGRQVSTVRKLFEPFYGNDGNLLMARFDPGALQNNDVWGGTPPDIGNEFWKYAVYSDPNWDFETQFSLEMVAHVNNLDLYGISTWKELTKLKQSGHKLLVYHGLMDSVINSENTLNYYEYVSRTMGLTSGELDSFFRYFPIPGMGHCFGGPGNWFIGATSQNTRVPGVTNISAEGGVLMSMVKWVEDGVAPDRIVGRNMNTQTGAQNAIKEHCKWPLRNSYLGGDPTAKASWGCH
ncbi:Tannase and feruloyl esterase [Orbilia javanica]|uniref:Carboxylic ester hydrolase n=1 Tax=Orbilia javanica TaxID=47235 RepID=A0AAN8MNM7_9PEZI